MSRFRKGASAAGDSGGFFLVTAHTLLSGITPGSSRRGDEDIGRGEEEPNPNPSGGGGAWRPWGVKAAVGGRGRQRQREGLTAWRQQWEGGRGTGGVEASGRGGGGERAVRPQGVEAAVGGWGRKRRRGGGGGEEAMWNRCASGFGLTCGGAA
ncbi:hypothetical protein GUJ93_ZPchr0012g21107 [Zizania palustris]|uniref:Uncharacterized protein n=1 Tax=Zizania palustris TaxID=103762 RepID=A0A8J6BQ40_ZIZPA|nr:hypothetical protein GUJ93_ZPchr0012g21107 [Zizania palustris]